MIFSEDFDAPKMDERLSWYCPPAVWSIEKSHLVVQPNAGTDYWQKTHYGFTPDNGHLLFLPVAGDFCLSTKVRYQPQHQFDQAGLMVRFSPEFWIKTSIEYGIEEPSYLGAVVTNQGYSDWSTQLYRKAMYEIELRIRKRGQDYHVEYLETDWLADQPANAWVQLRMAHLSVPANEPVQCGLYACCPKEAGFKAEFDYLRIESL